MAIVGKYTNTTNEKVAEFFNALSSTEEQLAAGAAKNEVETLEVINNGGNSYIIYINRQKLHQHHQREGRRVLQRPQFH